MTSLSYSVDYYVSLGLSLEDATAAVAKNKEATSKGVKRALAKKRCQKLKFDDISEDDLLSFESEILNRKQSKPATCVSAAVDLKILFGLSTGDAMQRILDALNRFPSLKSPFRSTAFILDLFGVDSPQYKRILELNKTCATCSFEKFSESYEDKDRAYIDFRIKYGSNNIENVKRKYGVDDAAAKEIIAARSDKVRQSHFSKSQEERDRINARKAQSLEGYILRHGEELGTQLYAEYCSRRQGLTSLDYYINLHGQEEGARIYQEKRGRHNIYSCPEFWIHRGHSEEDAKSIVSNMLSSRPHFSKEFCIAKYGWNEGLEIWKARQVAWQETMLSKPQEEIDDINRRKSNTLDMFIERYGEDEGTFRYMTMLENAAANRSVFFSKESTKFFLRLYRRLRRECVILSRDEVMFGSDSTTEYFIHSGATGVKFYDFTIRGLGLIVEYNGVAFHPKEGDVNWTSPYGADYETVLSHDKFKKTLAESKGFIVEYVWSDSNLESELDRLVALCKTLPKIERK